MIILLGMSIIKTITLFRKECFGYTRVYKGYRSIRNELPKVFFGCVIFGTLKIFSLNISNRWKFMNICAHFIVRN